VTLGLPASEGRRGQLALLIAVAIWAASYLVTKSALEGMGPMTVLSLRFGSAFVLLLPFAWIRGYRPSLSARPRFILFGVTGIVLHNGLETAGLVYTSSAAAALVTAALPALTAAAGVWFLRERVTVVSGVGIAISCVGVAMVAGAGNGSTGSLQLLGNVLVLGGLVAWVAYTIQSKRMPDHHHPLVSTIASIGGALLFLVPLTAWELATGGAPEVTAESVIAVGYLGALASAVAYWLWNHALSSMDAAVAAPYLNLIPALAVVLALLVGETIAPEQLIGGSVVAAGVWLSGWSARRSTRELDPDPA
jgi:drug/metabolite transporter (DMT)-like permease